MCDFGKENGHQVVLAFSRLKRHKNFVAFFSDIRTFVSPLPLFYSGIIK